MGIGDKVKVALTMDTGSDSFFDDRDDVRLDAAAAARRRGRLRDVADFVRREGIHEVYVALPLASGEVVAGSGNLGDVRQRRVHQPSKRARHQAPSVR